MTVKPKVEARFTFFSHVFVHDSKNLSCYDRMTEFYSRVIHKRRVALLCQGSIGWVTSCCPWVRLEGFLLPRPQRRRTPSEDGANAVNCHRAMFLLRSPMRPGT
jgi:hypothetical protein